MPQVSLLRSGVHTFILTVLKDLSDLARALWVSMAETGIGGDSLNRKIKRYVVRYKTDLISTIIRSVV